MKSENDQKLALGTVQFGTTYGISNTLGVPNDCELNNIFDIASASGIIILDSAPAYGDAQQRIGKFSANRFEVVSKFSNVHSRKSFNTLLNQSLKDLKISKLYALISHNSDELIANPELWDFLSEEKDRGRIGRIGYSLYTPKQLEKLLGLGMLPDIVQLPFNLLDRKFQQYLSELKRNGIEIHIRSVFLQGLFFLAVKKLSIKLDPIKPTLTLLHDLCKQNQIPVSELALAFAKNNPFIDKVLVGVASSDQLLKNIHEFSLNRVDTKVIEQINSLKVIDDEILNPATWL
jgi:aryl-alcohol dehydrogenase-like predicted oxidoreductase